MGITAERRTGYFATSASKQAANRGEKTLMVSVLIASTPAPRLRPQHPSLPRQPRRMRRRGAARPQSIPTLHSRHLRTFPVDRCAIAIKLHPLLAVPHQDAFLAQFHRGLAVSVQPVHRGVAAQQRCKRYPQLDVNASAKVTQDGLGSAPGSRSPQPPACQIRLVAPVPILLCRPPRQTCRS